MELRGNYSYCFRMSRAFVKESDSVDPVPDRPISAYANYVTARGLALIDDALARAQSQHAAAQAAADREALAVAARDLHYWQQRRASAELIPPPTDKDTV